MASSFTWGGETWEAGDLIAFQAWLSAHGADYSTWAADHPDANAILTGAPPAGGAPVSAQGTQVTPSGSTPEESAGAPAAAVASQPDSGTSETGTPIVAAPAPAPAPLPPPVAAPAPAAITAPLAGASPAGQISFDHDELEGLWLAAGGPLDVSDIAAAIAQAESGGCRFAHAGPTDDRPEQTCTYTDTDGENSYGLWQINIRAHPQYDGLAMYDAANNAAAAVAVSSNGTDFTPWTTYNNHAYQAYLTGQNTPVTPSVTPTTVEVTAGSTPSGIGLAWDDVLSVFSTNVPQAQDTVNDSLAAIKGAIV